MIVKKFQAETETEAILKAKDELGSGAVVLNVKTLKQRGVFRLFKKDVVEVTAALEEKEFINGINNKRPTMENKGANSGFISSQPMKNITGGSQIDLVADENIDMNSNAANIEKKLDSLHSLLENQINPAGSSAKRPAAATVMHEEIHAQDTGKKIVVVFPTPVGPIKNITFGLSPRDIVRGSPSFSIIFWYTADRMLSILDSFLSEASISAIISSAYFESTSLSTNFLYISCKNL